MFIKYFNKLFQFLYRIKIILGGTIILIIGYILGQFLPIEIFRPKITNNDITINDLYTRMIQLLGAFVTFLSVVVALFKEDIRRFFEYANIEISFKDDSELIETLEIDNTSNQSNFSSANIKSADRYEVNLQIRNSGKLPAKNCELHLDRVIFKEENIETPQELFSGGKSLNWKDRSEKSVLIPSSGRLFNTIIVISSPSKNSSTISSQQEDLNDVALIYPTLQIGGISLNNQKTKGSYEIYLSMYSENCKPVEKIIRLNWNGKWQHRLTEMKQCLQITLNKNMK